MKTEFRSSFAKDISAIKTKSLRKRIEELIELVEQTPSLALVPNVKKLRYSGNYYRVRIGEYRVGIVFEGDIVIFVRCLNRKDIYRYFP